MDVERLIADVARATGVRLDKTDPLVAVAILHERLLDAALVKLDRQIRVQADRVTTASTQAVADAKKEAELLLSEGGVWAEARIKSAGEAAAGLVLANLRQETTKAERASRVATRAAWATVVACLILLSGLGGVALAGLGHP